jgi:pimeloyl-ACP methyl ester carboxylesterase
VLKDDGSRLRVVTYGPDSAPPIVFAHGWTCNAQVWLPQVLALAEEFRVITYDQRGHGGSDFGVEPFHIDELGHDLSAVLAATVREDERAVVAGHSMGGMTIMSWAKEHPEEVQARAKAVVLTATAARDIIPRVDVHLFGQGGVGEKIAQAIVSGLAVPVSVNFVPVKGSSAVRFIVRNLVLCPEADDASVDLTADMAFACEPKVRAACLKMMTENLDLRDGLRNITVPTTVVAGGQDRLLPPVHSYEMAEILVETGWLDQLVVLPGSGHMVAMEATDEYNQLLLAAARTTPSGR